jgi:hypothetical protein
MACASQLRETQTTIGFDEHGPRAAAVVRGKHPTRNDMSWHRQNLIGSRKPWNPIAPAAYIRLMGATISGGR